MKIGVALSGCGIGGVSALAVLGWLRDEGIPLAAVSASGTPAIAALLYSCGCSMEKARALLEQFLLNRGEAGLDFAIEKLCESLPPKQIKHAQGLALAATGISDGITTVFTNDFSGHAENLMVYPLYDAYGAVSSVVGSVEGLGNFTYQGRRLCDYTIRHGLPFFPLLLAGCERILAFSFLPEPPQSAYDISIAGKAAATGQEASFYLEFRARPHLQDGATLHSFERDAISKLENCKIQLFEKLFLS